MADIFSSAVILFTVVTGIFPFVKAKEGDKYWDMITHGNFDEYWEKTATQHLTLEFKTLFRGMIEKDPSKRMSLAEIKVHTWFKTPYNL